MRLNLRRRQHAAAWLVACLVMAGACTASSTPSPTPAATASPTAAPGYDNPNDTPPPFSPPPTAVPSTPPSSTPTDAPALPSTGAWNGSTVYKLGSGEGGDVIGVGPDDTIYLLAARPVGGPKPSPSVFAVPDEKASVVAIRPDGSPKPGWPKAGVPVSGFPLGYAVGPGGTVFVVSGANPFGGSSAAHSSMTITAIDSTGKVVPGWPYRTPAAKHGLQTDFFMFGQGGRVCFMDTKPGATGASDLPMVVYCLGGDGKLLAGWPYSSAHSLLDPAIGPDGTLYVVQVTPTQGSGNWPDVLLAIGPDGKPRTGWTPWNPAGNEPFTTVLPEPDGRVFVLLGGDGGRAHLVLLASDGRLLSDLAGTVDGFEQFKAIGLSADGTLYVSTYLAFGGPKTQSGDSYVFAVLEDGTAKPGWPVRVDAASYLSVSPGGSVWITWEVYAPGTATPSGDEIAAFDPSGKLLPGFPMASLANGHKMAFDSNGTAYVVMLAATGGEVIDAIR